MNNLHLYFNNSPVVKQAFLTNPSIIFLTGRHSINNFTKLYGSPNKFVKTGPQYGNYCYIINSKMAKLLIDSFYPISIPYDDYVIYTISTNKKIVKCFSALPLLCYDTSSGHFSKYYTNVNPVQRTSVIKRLVRHLKHPITVTCDINNSILSLLFNNQIIIDSQTNDYHLMVHGSILDRTTDKSIIYGAGISSNNIVIAKPLYIVSVRGHLTRNYLIKMGIMCPNIVGDPLLLLARMHIKSRNSKYKYGIIVDDTSYYTLQNINDAIDIIPPEITKLDIDTILSCQYILSTSLLAIIIAHSYGIKAVWLCANTGNIAFDGLDYYSAFGISTVPIDIKKINQDTINDIVLSYPNPDMKMITAIQNNIIKQMPYIWKITN